MKTIAIATLMILACASAYPQFSELEQRNSVIDTVLAAVERIRQRVIDNGRDPIVIDYVEGSYVNERPIPGLFSARGSVTDLSVTGLSNIVVNDLSFDDSTNTLYFDFSVPGLHASIGAAEGEFKFWSRPSRPGRADGTFSIVNFRLTGTITVVVGDDGASVSDLKIDPTLEGIKSNIHMVLFGYDVSPYINRFFELTLPQFLQNNMDRIKPYLEVAILYLLDQVL